MLPVFTAIWIWDQSWSQWSLAHCLARCWTLLRAARRIWRLWSLGLALYAVKTFLLTSMLVSFLLSGLRTNQLTCWSFCRRWTWQGCRQHLWSVSIGLGHLQWVGQEENPPTLAQTPPLFFGHVFCWCRCEVGPPFLYDADSSHGASHCCTPLRRPRLLTTAEYTSVLKPGIVVSNLPSSGFGFVVVVVVFVVVVLSMTMMTVMIVLMLLLLFSARVLNCHCVR